MVLVGALVFAACLAIRHRHLTNITFLLAFNLAAWAMLLTAICQKLLKSQAR
jgi:hypothetical protein